MATLGNRNESDDDLNEMLEDLFAAVIQATDPGEPGRAIHMPFRFLPSQKVGKVKLTKNLKNWSHNFFLFSGILDITK